MTDARGKPWTEDEDRYIRMHYPTKGAAFTARSIEKNLKRIRSSDGVRIRANRIGVSHDPSERKKMVPLSYALSRGPNQQASDSIINAARKDGVLEREPLYPYRYIAPECWVNEWMKRFEEQADQGDWYMQNWMTTDQVAERFKLKAQTVSAYATDKSHSGRVVDRIRAIRRFTFQGWCSHGYIRRTFWNPDDVEKEAERNRIDTLSGRRYKPR